ncbi:MAG TPA: amidohydrolase family protein [Blastocatellia bacterium]|jgi:imidazolonepropionase-like amidohydrolase|nr:amidohydrolase family protein [Blastocatellia bacterium]
MKRKTLIWLTAVAMCVMASSQGGTLPAALAQNPPETYAISNARIVTVTGPVIERGTVVIQNGKIAAVGASVSVPPGAKVIDATGLSVYPGMIDSGTVMGLTEISSVPGTVDTSEIGDNNANIRADVAINTESAHIAVTRVNGVTTTLSAPRGGQIAGQSALLNLAGWVPKDMVLKSPVAMHINWPGGRGAGFDFGGGGQRRSPAELRREQEKQVDSLKKVLREAAAYGNARDARAKDPSLPKQETDLKLDALVPVVRGQMPVIISAQLESDIKGALAFAEEMKLKAIISGGVEAYKVADQLKARNIPVIVGPVLRMPADEDDPYDAAFTNAGLLSKAGVKIAFQTLDAAHSRDLPYNAGMAAAFGLPKEEALKAVTIYPAEIFGVADRIGSIEQGKVANIIVTDGDPLEIRTQVRYLFIDGRQIPLTSRHTELYEKYKSRP